MWNRLLHSRGRLVDGFQKPANECTWPIKKTFENKNHATMKQTEISNGGIIKKHWQLLIELR